MIAASLASAPVLSNRVLDSVGGNVAASRSASLMTGRLSMPLNRWSSWATPSLTAATIAGCACPRTALIWPDVKSRIGVPSLS